MEIKIGDHIRAFLKKSEGSKDFNGTEQAGREASPFARQAGRGPEEVTEVHPDGGYPSQPAIVNTKFSKYRLDQWEVKVVIPSFAKTSDGREACVLKQENAGTGWKG